MLPQIDTPIYELTLPISKQKIKFRSFLVKEQKILLIAVQSDDPDFVNENVRQILKNCCLTEKVDIDNMSSLDIEYFFLQLRARSIGEIVSTRYRCENKVDEETCGNLMNVDIELLDVNIDLSNYKDSVQLTDTVGVKFNYPNIKSLEKMNSDKNVVDKTFDIIIECVDYIFDENNFYYKKETSNKELQVFLESLSVQQFKKIEEYFENLPKLKKELNVVCNKCGFEHKINIEGLDNFLE